MKLLLLIFLSLAMATPVFAKSTLDKKIHTIEDWNSFDQLMIEAERHNRVTGWSYLISGVLVAVGSTVGAQNASDDGSKIAFGLTAGFGIGAASYGTLLLFNGNKHTVFYNTVRQSSLTPEQRNELVRYYLELEREREHMIRINRIVSNIVISSMSFYSASRAEDKNTKTLFQFLGTASLAIALSYTF